MGYFANGTEAIVYQEKYCGKCQNWTERDGDTIDGCPVWDFHYMDNYDLCNEKDNYLNKLIPRSADGLKNERCVMFLPRWEGDTT